MIDDCSKKYNDNKETNVDNIIHTGHNMTGKHISIENAAPWLHILCCPAARPNGIK